MPYIKQINLTFVDMHVEIDKFPLLACSISHTRHKHVSPDLLSAWFEDRILTLFF